LQARASYIAFVANQSYQKAIFAMVLKRNLHHIQGRTEGGKRGTIPRAPNDCGRRWKVAIMLQVLSSIQYICYRKTSSSKWGAKLASCLWRHLTSLRPQSHHH